MTKLENWRARIPFPLVILDFEASSLGKRSYPIEVGIAHWEDPDAEFQSWGALIKPTRDWCDNGEWLEQSEAVHGIPKSALATAQTADVVLSELCRAAAVNTVWCDGRHDRFWLQRFERAAGAKVAFKLRIWDALLALLTWAELSSVFAFLDADVAMHRAKADAERLMLSVVRAVAPHFEVRFSPRSTYQHTG